MYLLSTVVAPSFRSATLRIEELTSEQFSELLAQVDTNLCGHPVTNQALRQIRPDLPEPQKAFWQGDGIAIAARPKGGVRGASVTGDTPVTLDDLEFCRITYEAL
jgi:hypothetical protein